MSLFLFPIPFVKTKILYCYLKVNCKTLSGIYHNNGAPPTPSLR